MPPLLPRPRQADFAGRRVTPGDRRSASDPALPAQGYRLTIGEDGRVLIDAADPAGQRYAELTLDQLTEPDGTVPAGQITDWPDFPVRAVMLDISRGMAHMPGVLDELQMRIFWRAWAALVDGGPFPAPVELPESPVPQSATV